MTGLLHSIQAQLQTVTAAVPQSHSFSPDVLRFFPSTAGQLEVLAEMAADSEELNTQKGLSLFVASSVGGPSCDSWLNLLLLDAGGSVSLGHWHGSSQQSAVF